MADDTEENSAKPVGVQELTGGVAAGAAGGTLAAQILAKTAFNGLRNEIKDLSLRQDSLNDMLSDAQVVDGSPEYFRLNKLFEKGKAREPQLIRNLQRLSEQVGVDDPAAIEKELGFKGLKEGVLAKQAGNALKNPIVVFKTSPTLIKIAILGAVAIPAALAVKGIHSFRNRHAQAPESFVAKIEDDKQAVPPATGPSLA